MNKNSLVNLFIALFITILVVFVSGLSGWNGTMTSVFFCALVSAIITVGFEVAMKVTGRMITGNWMVYLTEVVVCFVVSFLALLVV